MSLEERINPILQLIAVSGGSIEGKKKLHKEAFLCQAAGTELGLDFIFYYYGVFSPYLATLLLEGKKHKLIDYNEEDNSEGAVEINLVANLDEREYSNRLREEPGFQLIFKLKDKSARTLEVLSTIVYLQKCGYSGEEIKIKLKQLKGNLSKYYSESFQLAKEHFGIDLSN